jgi:lipoate-protein ligase B
MVPQNKHKELLKHLDLLVRSMYLEHGAMLKSKMIEGFEMDAASHKKLYRIDLGRTKYINTWSLQKKLVELRFAEKLPDLLLFTEHEPVITKGRATNKENLLVTNEELRKQHVDLFEVERGGDITYHGPGQAVVYPIVDLNNWGRDLHSYIRGLENITIDALKEVGIEGSTKKGLTGVWVANTKLAAIGIAVSRWIAYHGLALNVNTDLEYFKLIIPCGINQFSVGSVESLLHKKIEITHINNLLADHFATAFHYDIETVKLNDLLEAVRV